MSIIKKITKWMSLPHFHDLYEAQHSPDPRAMSDFFERYGERH